MPPSSGRCQMVDYNTHHGYVLPQDEFGARDLVLLADEPGHFDIDALGLLDHLLHVDAAAVLLDHLNVGRLLIDPDPEAVQFRFDDLLVGDGTASIEHHQYQVAGARGRDDLPAPTLAIGRALDDPRQIEDLDPGAAVLHRAGDTRQGREFDLARGGPGTRQRREEGRLSHRRETDQPDPRVARFRHLESPSGILGSSRLTSGAVDQLGFQLCDLRLERPEVVVGGLVLLRPGLHFDVEQGRESQYFFARHIASP